MVLTTIIIAMRDDTHRRVADRLHDHGSRYTATRKKVIAALHDAPGPLTPADLHHRVRNVPLSSLYRNLSVLEDAGVVARSHDMGGVGLVELAEWLAGHHHHLICVQCGDITDVEVPDTTEARIDALAREIASRAGYGVHGHRIDIEGTCAGCLKT